MKFQQKELTSFNVVTILGPIIVLKSQNYASYMRLRCHLKLHVNVKSDPKSGLFRHTVKK